MNEYCVYILRCADKSLYVGITNNVERRIGEHGAGLDPGCYTFSRRPITLVYVARFSEVMDAIAFEKQVKRWSRKKKEALIAGEWEELIRLSKTALNAHFYPLIRIIRSRVMVSLSNHETPSNVSPFDKLRVTRAIHSG